MIRLKDVVELFEIQTVYNEKDSNQEQEQKTEYDIEYEKIYKCGKAYIELEGKISGDEYYKRIDCERWYCQICGGLNGIHHKKRKKRIIEKFGGKQELKNKKIGQWIFTIPKDIRYYFRSRNALNSIFRMVKRIIENKYGKRNTVYYLHIFGDDVTEFHPHINVHIELSKDQKLFIDKEELETVREKWRQALQGYIRERIDIVNISYSYRVGIKKILHAIRYMSRPIEPTALEKQNEIMKNFLVLKMKKFRYVRTYVGRNEQEENEYEKMIDMKELENKVGEPLRYVRTISAKELFLKNRWNELERIKDGLFRKKKINWR